MGYKLQADGSCKKCEVNNCVECEDITKCTQCMLGYSPIDGTHCRECLLNCAVCSAIDITQCSQCFEGYYLVSGTTCQKCSANCK